MKNSSVVRFALLFIAPWVSNTAVAEDTQYRYSSDRPFYSDWFVKKEMPVVGHSQTSEYCSGGCHWTFLPGLLPQRSWGATMENLEDHFGEKIQLPPETSKAILNYLAQGAAEFTESRVSIKILDSVGEEPPLRISTIPYIQKHHEDVEEDAWNHPSIGGRGNCVACHQNVEKDGLFDEDEVDYPEEYKKEIEAR
jgi:hypothetical protein